MSLTITTVNVNGIRAAVRQRSEENRGFHQWLRRSSTDVVLMQEVRATEQQTLDALAPAIDAGWHYIGAEASAKGRAGVGILSRFPLADVQVGIPGFEDAGRYIEASLVDAPLSDVRVASLYLPSGAANTEKQDEKYRFLDIFEDILEQKATSYSHMTIGGDWNICHRREDLKNWKANQKKSGFLADERAFMDAVFGTFPDEESQVADHGDFLGRLITWGRRGVDKRRSIRSGLMWRGAFTLTMHRTHGGPTGGKPLTQTPGGASITKQPRVRCWNERRKPGWTKPLRMSCDGQTTRRLTSPTPPTSGGGFKRWAAA